MLKIFPEGINFEKIIFEYDVVVVAGLAVDDMVVVVVVVDFLNQEKVEESDNVAVLLGDFDNSSCKMFASFLSRKTTAMLSVRSDLTPDILSTFVLVSVSKNVCFISQQENNSNVVSQQGSYTRYSFHICVGLCV